MSSAENNSLPDASERENLHLLFFAAIRFLLDLLGIHGKMVTELVLLDNGERCDITIRFTAAPYPSSGIFRTGKKHMLIEYKSHYYPLDEKALIQACNYANLQAFNLVEHQELSDEITLSIFGFRMRKWFQKAVAEKYELEKAEAGIYDVRGYTRHMLRLILIDELIGDEYACLRLLGENPTLADCLIVLEQVGILKKQGNEEAVNRGIRILCYVFRKHPELLKKLKNQGGSQMAYDEFTKMFEREADRIARVEVENFHLTTENSSLTAENSSLTAENSSLTAENSNLTAENSSLTTENSNLTAENSNLTTENSSLKKSVSGLEQSVSELGKVIAFLKQQIPGLDLEALVKKAKQMGLNANLLL